MDNQKNPNELLNSAREVQHIENKVSFVQNIFGALVFWSVGAGLLYFFTQKVDGEPLLVYIFPFFCFLLPLIIIIQSFRVTKKKLGPPTASTPFSGSDMVATVTKQPYERAHVTADSSISGWLGAVDRTDLKGLSGSVGLKEYVNSAENTLLLIDNKIVALALTQEDFNLLGGSGVMNTIAQFAATEETAVEQKQSVTMLNYKKWPQIIELLKSRNISDFLNTHYNFALELSKIERIEPRHTFINPGVYIHLSDGTTLKYNTMSKDQITPFTDSLRALGCRVA